MKVLFLDFDGVLNSCADGQAHPGLCLDRSALSFLRRIVDATDARIVLSTSWRKHWDPDPEKCDAVGREINELFSAVRLEIYGKTPVLPSGRGSEIAAWLREHPQVGTFVVLDDSPFEEGILSGHFVLTSGLRSGISAADAEKAVSILNRNGSSASDRIRISVLGDSVSAFEGFVPSEYAVFYDRKNAERFGLRGVEDLWWAQVIDRLGGVLCANSSWSGSYVAGWTDASGQSTARIRDLGTGHSVPDLVFVAMGANDCGGGVPLDGDPEDRMVFAPSYRRMIRGIREAFPGVQIACLTIPLTEPEVRARRIAAFRQVGRYNAVIRRICAEENGILLDLYDETCGYPTVDGLHPDAAGQRMIADAVIRECGRQKIRE